MTHTCDCSTGFEVRERSNFNTLRRRRGRKHCRACTGIGSNPTVADDQFTSTSHCAHVDARALQPEHQNQPRRPGPLVRRRSLLRHDAHDIHLNVPREETAAAARAHR